MGKARITAEQIERLRQHAALGLTSRQLAVEIGCAHSHICWLARKYGVPFRHPRNNFTDEEIEIVRQGALARLSTTEVKAQLPRRSASAIAAVARRRHWKLTNTHTRQAQLKEAGSDVKLVDRQNGYSPQAAAFWHIAGKQAVQLGLDKTETYAVMARKFGVTRNALIGFLWRAGVVGIVPTTLEQRLPTMPKTNQCMYPLHEADEPARWCARPVERGPYCDSHYQLCYISDERRLAAAMAEQAKIIADSIKKSPGVYDQKWKVADAPA